MDIYGYIQDIHVVLLEHSNDASPHQRKVKTAPREIKFYAEFIFKEKWESKELLFGRFVHL